MTASPSGPRVLTAIRDEFSPWLLVITAVLAVASVLTTWSSMGDAEGDGPGLLVPIAAPAVVAAWACLELFWRDTVMPLPTRLFLACVSAPLPAALASALVVGGLSALPAAGRTVRAASEANGGFHYWWDDGVGAITGVWTFFGSWGIGGAAGLGVLLVVVLPILSWIRTDEVLDGTRVERHRQGRVIITGVYVALAAVVVGLCVTYLL
ncbi:hypothetical protein [Knoellia aerolata]|uniref:Uncharacterized protein n=1 Tax=Knoellia aerolata DSM 18566 TaxID=1385519 RepID=A0A0A0JQN5_9MICO|nr:hypothetical protein [Knoellia aerolata]KGN39795.1 hypothetical protein N801_09055 [Knoellia aerolata DSM 18566]